MIFKKNIGDHLLLKLTFLHFFHFFFHKDFSQSLIKKKSIVAASYLQIVCKT